MANTVVFILYYQDHVLVERRKSDDKYYPDLFLAPGGKLEPLEGIHVGLLREAKEELGISIRKSHRLFDNNGIFFIDGPTPDFEIYPFIVTEWEGVIPSRVLDSGTDLFWMSLAPGGIHNTRLGRPFFECLPLVRKYLSGVPAYIQRRDWRPDPYPNLKDMAITY